jgi:hypothetical protein
MARIVFEFFKSVVLFGAFARTVSTCSIFKVNRFFSGKIISLSIGIISLFFVVEFQRELLVCEKVTLLIISKANESKLYFIVY